jgi:hypothetical protein
MNGINEWGVDDDEHRNNPNILFNTINANNLDKFSSDLEKLTNKIETSIVQKHLENINDYENIVDNWQNYLQEIVDQISQLNSDEIDNDDSLFEYSLTHRNSYENFILISNHLPITISDKECESNVSGDRIKTVIVELSELFKKTDNLVNKIYRLNNLMERKYMKYSSDLNSVNSLTTSGIDEFIKLVDLKTGAYGGRILMLNALFLKDVKINIPTNKNLT